jgi:hypothetical protein
MRLRFVYRVLGGATRPAAPAEPRQWRKNHTAMASPDPASPT